MLRRVAFPVLVTCFLSGLPAPEVLAAPQEVGPVPITKIRTGWGSDTFAIETGQPIANPANCDTPDAYLIDATHNGYKTHYAAALTAYAMSRQIMVIVSDAECIAGRPKIFGIYLLTN